MRPNPIPNTRVLIPIHFAQIQLKSGQFICLNSSVSPYSIDGHIFEPAGTLGAISPVKETMTGEISKLSLSLQGLPLHTYPSLASERYRGQPVKLWIGILDPDTYELAAPPRVCFFGKVVSTQLSPGPESAIRLDVSSNLVTVKTKSNARYTQAEQSAKYPDDKGLEFVANLKNQRLEWGV